jgi:tRNA(Ile2) C34 agmatinyltransferase TiaS
MACPTCNQTMQNLGVPGERKFWCPNCGTLKAEQTNGHVDIEAPTVIRRGLVPGLPRASTGESAETLPRPPWE